MNKEKLKVTDENVQNCGPDTKITAPPNLQTRTRRYTLVPGNAEKRDFKVVGLENLADTN